MVFVTFFFYFYEIAELGKIKFLNKRLEDHNLKNNIWLKKDVLGLSSNTLLCYSDKLLILLR